MRLAFQLATLICAAVLPVLAQEFRATLQGTVSDPSNAGVPNATITLRNVDTGIEREATTDTAGYYLFQFVVPGNYSLTAKASGFKTAVRDGVQLSISDSARVDVALALGAASETISVSADVTAVQADSSSLGSVVSQKIVDTLPLKGHSSLYMYNLAPGVVGNRFLEDVRPSDTGTNVLFTANGAPAASGEVSVDGVANTVNVGRGLYLSPWVPATEAVGEVKLLMGTLPAEYGRAAGAFTNIVIKSGANDFHGSVYEYLRNSAMDANLFFSRGQGQRLTPYNANVYGASIGGPIVVPKLYNGKNRTFFFFNYEGAKEGNGQSTSTSVPTLKMRQGNFSEVGAPIYNPFSVHTVDGLPIRDPLPGNIVPANLQDPVAQKIMNFWPEPNTSNINPSTPWVQNFVQGSKWPQTRDVWVLKLDHQLTAKNHTFFRINSGDAFFNFNYAFDGLATTGRNVVNRPNFGIALNDTYLITPSTILDIRVGYAYGKEQQRPYSYGFDLASLGFPQAMINATQFQNFPGITVSGFQSLAGIGYKEQPGYNYSLQSSLSIQRGKHLLKMGADIELLRGNFLTNNNPSGAFSFAQTQTGGPRADTTVATSGFSMASFMMGYASGGSIDSVTGVSIQNLYSGIYFQDDYRVTPRLTLNLGLRYEFQTPTTERYNRTTRGFDYYGASPLSVPGLNLRGGLIYAGANGVNRGIYNSDRNNFGPRIGLAYTLTPRTVLRAGYSLSYIAIVGMISATGYSNTTPMVTTQDGITPKDLLRNPFPSGLLPAIGNSQGSSTLIGQGISFFDPSDRTPMFHNWHFDIQRELAPRTMLSVSYVGSRAIGIMAPASDFTGAVNLNINQLDPQYLSMGADLLKVVPNPFAGIITSGALAGPTVSQSQLLRPYPQYTGVTRMAPGYGNSVYHSAQFQLEKRTSIGVTAIVAYTIAKNIGDLNNPDSAYNRQVERALSPLDVPQRLTISAAWDLPFGRKRRFGTNMPRALDLLAGGWMLSTFDTFQAGFPLAFGLARCTAGANSCRPNAIGDPSQGVSGSVQSRLSQYFNTAAFSQPADFTYGNTGPYIGTARAPGMNNLNMTLSKTFPIQERWRVEFRGSMYNFLNHPVFGAPNTTYGNADFGRVFNQANLGRQMEFMAKIIF